MDETILTWNVTNWITVILMAFLGFAALGLLAQLYHNQKGTADA